MKSNLTRIFTTTTVMGAFLLACAGPAPHPRSASPRDRTARTTPEKSSSKQVVMQLLTAFAKGDKATVKRLISADYRQHSSMAADGVEGILAAMDQLAKLPQRPRVRVVRMIEDGSYIALNSEYDWGTKKQAVLDLFRIVDGKVVEHWDGLQNAVAKTASGRTMFDGPTKVVDLAQSAANKVLVTDFVTSVLVRGQFNKLPGFFNGDSYIQHNPMVPDGLSGLGKAMAAMKAKGISMRYSKLHRVIGEGNFVLTQSEGTFAGKPTIFYDLFRVEDGKIAEHWDVVQAIPAKLPHGNGMF